jgi:hypothetical protein
VNILITASNVLKTRLTPWAKGVRNEEEGKAIPSRW